MLLVFLYYSLLSKRKVGKLCVTVAYVFSTMTLSLVVLLINDIYIYLLTTIVLISVIALLCFEDTVLHKIFWIVLFTLIVSVSEPIVIGILCIANLGTPERFLQSSMGRYLGMIGTNIMYLWLIGIMHKVINKKIKNLPLKYWILIVIIPITSIFLLQTILNSFIEYSVINYWLLGISLAGVIYINIAMFNFFESYENKMRIKYLESLKHQQEENYKLLALSYKQVREFKHDIENQFSVLSDMLKSGDNDAAIQYIDKLNSFVRLANRVCFTGNNAVDSIVNIKGSLAKTYDIDFICKINIKTSIKTDELELCRIIGNGLDNAIEGCLRSNAENKHIMLYINEEREKLFLVITNTSEEVDVSNLSSTKADSEFHGIGVSSIKSSVERLGGLVKFGFEDEIFEVTIMVNNSSLI